MKIIFYFTLFVSISSCRDVEKGHITKRSSESGTNKSPRVYENEDLSTEENIDNGKNENRLEELRKDYLKETLSKDEVMLLKIRKMMSEDPSNFLNCLIISQDISTDSVKQDAERIMKDYLKGGAKASDLENYVKPEKYEEMFNGVFSPENNTVGNIEILSNIKNKGIKNYSGHLTDDNLIENLKFYHNQIEPYLCSVRYVILQAHFLGVDLSLSEGLELYLDKYNPIGIIKRGVEASDDQVLKGKLHYLKPIFLKNLPDYDIDEEELFEHDNYVLGAPGEVLGSFIESLSKNKIVATPVFFEGEKSLDLVDKIKSSISTVLKQRGTIGGFDYKNGKNIRSWHYSPIVFETENEYYTLDSKGALQVKNKDEYIDSLYVPMVNSDTPFNQVTEFMEIASGKDPLKAGILKINKGGYNLLQLTLN